MEMTVIIRYCMLLLTGWMMNRGLMDSSMADAAVGLLTAIGTYLWYKYEDKKAREVAAARATAVIKNDNIDQATTVNAVEAIIEKKV
jgi:hypothetical protein